VSEPALDLVPDHRAPHRLAHDEAHHRRFIGFACEEMCDQHRTAGASPTAYRVGELVTSSHPRRGRQHRVFL
jgi:hypothetical protein